MNKQVALDLPAPVPSDDDLMRQAFERLSHDVKRRGYRWAASDPLVRKGLEVMARIQRKKLGGCNG